MLPQTPLVKPEGGNVDADDLFLVRTAEVGIPTGSVSRPTGTTSACTEWGGERHCFEFQSTAKTF